jgi:hypothetical protein
MILTAMQSAAIRVLGRRPNTFFGASQTFEGFEITDWVNEVAQDIAKYQDWQGLTRVAVLTGNGGQTVFALPTDYDRQLQDADIQRNGYSLWGYVHIKNLNDFLASQDSGWANTIPGGWIICGNSLNFSPAPSGEARFPYISKNWAIGADGTPKAAFDADTDSFVLPERLLTLGLVWRWRENKKLDATGDQEAFIKALDEYGSSDKGSSIIRHNRARRSLNTAVPYMGVAPGF